MEVKVQTAELELRTAKLTKALLKQLPVLGLQEIRPFLKPDGNEKPECILGWVHGSVLGDDWKCWLIVRLGPGSYGRYDAMKSTCVRYPQIYVV